MAITMKAGAVTFTHAPNYTGEVEIRRGEAAIRVSFESLKKLVAESVRTEAIARLEAMKPAELLGRAGGVQ